MIFAKETARQVIEEIQPLLIEHYKEIAHYQDIKLEPDFAAYTRCEESGNLRIFTVRVGTDLVGYCIFFIKENLHYQSSVQAVQDVLFLKKEYRGHGMRFIGWIDEQLKEEGVEVIYQHVKAAHNFGPKLEKMGYELVDLIYARRV